MLHRLSLKIANRYAAKDINHHPIDVVAYGIESLIANAVIIILLFLFGIIIYSLS